MLEDETAGDPSRSLKWKRKSLSRLSVGLGSAHPASPPTVSRLLGLLDYSPKINRKQVAVSSPDRNEQFEYLHVQKQLFVDHGWPFVYVDTKKRELIGLFKNPGAIWCRDPHRVNIYDFRSLAEGIGIPYGLYDAAQNAGYVCVGTSADTPAFAVDSIVWWWQTFGRVQYPTAPHLLIMADGGGSNGYLPRLWKYALQHCLADPFQLQVTVCHYPTGASKWNWVEHRLFSPISANWAGEPLDSYTTMLNFLEHTTTKRGLVVKALLNQKPYPTGIKISDDQMADLNLRKHDVLPRWNYTLTPHEAPGAG